MALNIGITNGEKSEAKVSIFYLLKGGISNFVKLVIVVGVTVTG